MLSNRFSCNIYNLLIASCKIDWQPLTANWAVVDCLSITSPVINVASVMLVLPLSGRRAICFCFHQGNQRPRCPPGFPAQTLVIPPTEGRPLTRGEEPSRAALQDAVLVPRGERRGPQDCSLPE